jgi:glutamine amidotransferase
VRRRPFLGICVGLQLLADEGREHETTAGLGWVHGVVVRLAPEDLNLKVPHMGWNELELIRPHPLFAGIVDGSHMYFVHSYHFAPSDPDDRAALVRHGGSVVAAIAHDNLFGTQFHPEKSQAAGLRLLDNFLHWSP